MTNPWWRCKLSCLKGILLRSIARLLRECSRGILIWWLVVAMYEGIVGQANENGREVTAV